MKLPRDLSGREVAGAIPDHKRLRLGTLNGILLAVASHKHMQKGAITELFSR